MGREGRKDSERQMVSPKYPSETLRKGHRAAQAKSAESRGWVSQKMLSLKQLTDLLSCSTAHHCVHSQLAQLPFWPCRRRTGYQGLDGQVWSGGFQELRFGLSDRQRGLGRRCVGSRDSNDKESDANGTVLAGPSGPPRSAASKAKPKESKANPGTSTTPRNLCMIDWCKKHPGGYLSQFKAYWDAIENTSDAEPYKQVSANAATSKTKAAS
ncbi:hypothetical protein B0H10DRAFT_923540 [Mycena sp. CBHHK59/15]|nr:hypothetical protein B0H10DRAFT_923540 [Mycena sp. CBHHK59/15]